MKHSKPHFTNFAVSLLLGTIAAVPPATTAQILRDGDFDSLPIGSAPNVLSPAGAWFFQNFPESQDTEFTIVSAPGRPETDHCLRVIASAADQGHHHLVNVFTAPLRQSLDTIIVVSFDVYVSAGAVGGPGIYLANGGHDYGTDRGPQLEWHPTGILYARSVYSLQRVWSYYPRDAWQSVRMEIDLLSGIYSVFWGIRGAPLEQIGTGLRFRSGPQTQLDRFVIARFQDATLEVDAFVDNVRVTEFRPDNPSLSLQTTGDSIILSWPAAATTGFWLQSTPNLTPSGTWLDVTNPPTRIGDRFSVTIPISSPAKFFRLRML